jgi:mRNA-degrading endonuclease RelE of RelBE toxin-antitoxin system
MSGSHEIRYAEEAVADIRALRKFDQQKILEGIELHLTHQPRKESKSRIKAMLQPFWSQYRLRLDDFRVYYDVDDEGQLVHVLRVLLKTTQPTPEGAS